MSSRFLALAFLATMGCDIERESESVFVQTTTGVEIRLASDREDQYVDGSELSFEWHRISSPANSTYDLRIEDISAIVVFNEQGRYVLDRWIHFQLSSVLTHRYIIDVANSIPRAEIQAPMSGNVGLPVRFNATNSSDFEDSASLQYQWSLKFRPIGSSSVLSETDSEFTEFTPDQAGDYVIELNVFDGQDWDETPDEATIVVQ